MAHWVFRNKTWLIGIILRTTGMGSRNRTKFGTVPRIQYSNMIPPNILEVAGPFLTLVQVIPYCTLLSP